MGSSGAKLGLVALAFAMLAMASCASAPLPSRPPPPVDLKSPFTGFRSPHYSDPSAWLCLPGREDACAGDLDSTELLPDGSRMPVHDTPVEGASDVDCFYVYPTVDLSLGPANHADFRDTAAMARSTVAQAARFRTTCRLFVPLYRQVTIGTYLRSPATREEYLAVAESDVTDAFLHYMGTFNAGRRVVLIGHSQGAEMVTRLLKRFFDDDAAMRERLLLALPIGGDLEVAKGSTTGGTFKNVPACSHPDETGCVIGYRSFLEAFEPKTIATEVPRPGNETVCVNPAEIDAGSGRPFSRTFFPLTDDVRKRLRGVDGITTPFVMLRGFYSGRCLGRADGFRYLAVSASPAVGDARVSPVDLSTRLLRGPLGLHILDFQFAQGDLVDLVARRVQRSHVAAARQGQ